MEEKNAEDKAEEKSVNAPLKVRRALENIYENPWVVQTANQCKMGDIVAMMEFAQFFKNQCSEALQKLLDAYEANPAEENENLLDTYLKKNYYESMAAEAYMLWLARASLYGNKKAEDLIKNLSYYQENSYIPYGMMTGGKPTSMRLWASNFLWKIGWIDMIREQEDCGLTFHKEEGYYDFWYVDNYYPADEDGFGAEWEYEDVFYDEFFCSVSKKKGTDFSDELQKLEKIREEYWSDPAHDAMTRKYTRRP